MPYRRIRHTKNSIRLFNLLDQLHEQSEVVLHDAIVFGKKNKLDIIENGAKEVEKIAIEMQELVNSMRRGRGKPFDNLKSKEELQNGDSYGR